jgi:hypothetical protein
MTLKRINDFMQRAENFANELFNLMPEQYLERPDMGDETAWPGAVPGI